MVLYSRAVYVHVWHALEVQHLSHRHAAAACGVSRSSVARTVNRVLSGGPVAPSRKGLLHSTRKLGPVLLLVLRVLYQQDETMYLEQAARKLQYHCSWRVTVSDVCRGLKLLGITRQVVRQCKACQTKQE